MKIALKQQLMFVRKEGFFLLLIMLCSFCITMEHAIVKPASNSIFIALHGAKTFPLLWILMLPLNFLMVVSYNHALSKLGSKNTFMISVISVLILNGLAGGMLKNIPGFSFFHCIVKDLYVLLMFQQLWSYIHLKMKYNEAKFFYGLIFSIGGIGSICGSVLTHRFALSLGSQQLLYFSIPIYSFLFALFLLLLSRATQEEMQSINQLKQQRSPWHGFELIKNSRYLIFIMLLVIFMQIASTLLEYEFNMQLESYFPIQDVRTSYTGRVFSWINTGTVTLQLFGSSLLLHTIGLRFSHLFIPTVLLSFSLIRFLIPSFGLLTFSYGCIKSFDHSIFRIFTEMLYIPLSAEEKFKAKSIIDVLSYRSSRAFASLFVLLLGLFLPMQTIQLLNPLLICAIFLLWIYGAFKLFQYREKLPSLRVQL